MLKYFVLLLIASTCFAYEQKFHFMDCVKVNKGFYKDCKGKVTQFYGIDMYEVAINNCKSESFYGNFEEDQLELAKGCEK